MQREIADLAAMKCAAEVSIDSERSIALNKRVALGFSLFSYLVFFAVFLYTIGFVGDFVVPKSIDSGSSGSTWQALVIDAGLIGLFGLQHSLMARKSFKQWWTKIVPKPVERSMYVLFASLLLILLFWQWRPLPHTLWDVQPDWLRIPLWSLFGIGWLMVFASAQMINGAHLFGLQQVREHVAGKTISGPKFQTPGLYRYVRHPLMLGFIIAFWATPSMSVGHAMFALLMTGYIFVGLWFEERSLLRRFGDRYRQYREQVPMIVPRMSAEIHFKH